MDVPLNYSSSNFDARLHLWLTDLFVLNVYSAFVTQFKTI